VLLKFSVDEIDKVDFYKLGSEGKQIIVVMKCLCDRCKTEETEANQSG